ncbi:lantibiotic dehydratase [Streptomyces sp. NPDC048172]|uniref:lantibiotic dehydratase n=1 Tax=Streptomyces sp. NPDC048172 TaxID=3365505 RepID=UPI0037195CEF
MPSDAQLPYLAEHFMLRVAGLPAVALAPLRAPRAAERADEALELERRLAELAPGAGDALAKAVADTGTGEGDTRGRRRLLALRRDIHNGRAPGDPDPDALLDTLSPALAAPVRAWLGARRRLGDTLSEADSSLAAELRDARAHLRTLAEDPALRAGLQAASPSLDAALPAYVGTGDTPPRGKSARKAERALVSYVQRAAVKTSPFSTLTAVTYGRFGPPEPYEPSEPYEPEAPVGLTGDGGLRLVTRARPSLIAVHELLAAARENPAASALSVRPVGGLRREDGRLRYVRRRYRSSPPGDLTLAAPGVLEESVCQLSAGPVLTEVLALLEKEDRLTLDALAAHLHAVDPADRPREQLDAYLARLVELGLLTFPALALDIHHADPVTDLAARLRADTPDTSGTPGTPDAPGPSPLADTLDRLAAHAAAFPLAPREERARAVRAMRAESAEAQRALGRAEPVVPRTAVYEDAVPAGRVATASTAAWEEGPLPALRRFARVLPAFDLLLSDRLVARGRFRTLYGPGGTCEDVAGFAQDLHTTCGEWLTGSGGGLGRLARDGTYEPRPNPYGLPEVEALDAAHRAFATALQQGQQGLPARGHELVLDDAVLDRVAALLPHDTGALPRSHSFYLQWAPSPASHEGGLAVLNWAYTGMGQPLARFARSFGAGAETELCGAVRRRHARMLPPDAVFADLSGGYDTSNLSLRPALAPYRLTCPGEPEFNASDGTGDGGHAPAPLPFSDLFLVDDEESGVLQLRSRRLGKRVIPLYLGGLIPMALPRVQRTLLALSPAAMPLSDVWACLAEPPRHRPRVRVGNLVLARRSWRFGRGELPPATHAPDTARGFLDRRRWWRRAGLPPRAVVRAGPRDKPLPVDADSPLSLALCDHALAPGEFDAVFTEMLPDTCRLPLRVGGSAYVSELCVELDMDPNLDLDLPRNDGRTTKR